MHRKGSMAAAFFTGMVGGLAASRIMNQFWAVGSKLQRKLQFSSADPENQNQQQQREIDNPTVKVAEVITRPLLNRELRQSEKKIAGSVVHYAFGALVGGLYGVLSEVTPLACAGFGIAYGTAAWLVADEMMVPALKLSQHPQEYSFSQHLGGLGAHLVYGATTEAMRRSLRAAV
jgi:putative membrane protein